jgi:antitoxin component YwqK of YwqJK toxin-antitoxin module
LRYSENGWKEGEHTGWFENGQKQFVYHFTNDMFDGNQKEWLSNGTLYSDLNYEKGEESGSQRIWYTNGRIKTNYIIKNNRRYGLLGTKNCVNSSDSVFVKL